MTGPDTDVKDVGDLFKSDRSIGKKLEEWITSQFQDITPETDGVMILKYGTEDYMVSREVATTMLDKVKHLIKRRYPKVTVLMIPWFIEVSMQDMKKYTKEE